MPDAAIALVITHAGMQRFTDAQTDTDIDLTLAEVGLTSDAFTATPDLTTLPGEFRRLSTVTGKVVGDQTVHLTVTDDVALAAYSAKGLGLFLADGTLFAAYGQAGALLTKVANLALMVAVDVVFPVTGVGAIDFGELGFLNPPATSTTRGVVELATLAEAQAGTAGPLAVSPPVLKALLDALAATMLPKATAEQVAAGTDDASAITPAGLASLPHLLDTTGYTTLPGGLILQWGRYRSAIMIETAIGIGFPLTFPHAVFATSITGFIAAPSQDRDLWPQLAGEATPTGLTVQLQSDGSDAHTLDGFDWCALGY